MAAGIIDPTKVVRYCLEHASSVAKTFLMSDCIVIEIKEPEPDPEPLPAGNPMDNSEWEVCKIASNVVLSHFNDVSENCFAEVMADFLKNSRLLKSDLDHILEN
ncbi:hypothetical protein Dimus_010007 [Dionaea muscipula]